MWLCTTPCSSSSCPHFSDGPGVPATNCAVVSGLSGGQSESFRFLPLMAARQPHPAASAPSLMEPVPVSSTLSVQKSPHHPSVRAGENPSRRFLPIDQRSLGGGEKQHTASELTRRGSSGPCPTDGPLRATPSRTCPGKVRYATGSCTVFLHVI